MKMHSTAILIDFAYLLENANGRAGSAEAALEDLQRLHERLEKDCCRVLVRQVYADWDHVDFDSIQQALVSRGFVPRYVMAQEDGHGVALELSLDCLQLLLSRDDLEQVVLVAGDESYQPLVRRVRELGRQVVLAARPGHICDDLAELVGEESLLDLSLLGADDRSGPQRSRERQSPSSRPFRPSEDDLDRAMHLVLQADRQFNHRGIYLAPFYKDWMNPGFPDLSNPDRKRIMDALSRERAVAIRQKEDVFERGKRFSVLHPVRENERYLRLKAEMDRGGL